MVEHVLLRGDGAAVHEGGTEAPVADRGLDFFVDAIAEALQDLGGSHVAECVDGDFDDDSPFHTRRYFRARDSRVREVNGERRAHVVAGQRSVEHRAKRRARARRIGDSLRRKIDQGLARSAFGVVIFSVAFFAKGWPQYELDGIVTRSVAGEQNLLPIWHKVSKDEVRAQSPSLADKVARSTSAFTAQEIAEEIARRVRPDLFDDDE